MGELPKNWVECQLDEIASVQSGGTPSRGKKEYWDGEIPWVKISDIKNLYVNESSEYITEKGLENSAARIFPKGTILFTIFATIGRIGILNINATTNQAIAGITPTHLINHKYLTFALTELSNSILEHGKGVAQKNINQAILKSTKIPLPPLPEQNRIVAKLDQLFGQLDLIKAGMEKIPVLLKAFRQQVLSMTTVGILTKGKEFIQLNTFGIKIKTGPFGSALHKEDYIDNGIPVINPSHIKNGQIYANENVSVTKEKFEELRKFMLEPDDVLLGRRGEMGRAATYKDYNKIFLCGTGSIILRCNNKVYPDYLSFYLRSPVCVQYLTQNSVGSTMINLNQNILNSLMIPNLTYEEQKTMVEKIEMLLSKADAIEARYQTLKQQIDNLPQAILHKAFKGELTQQLESDGDARELLKEIEALKKAAAPKKGKRKLGMAAEEAAQYKKA